MAVLNRPDDAAQAALAEDLRRYVTYAFFDIAGDPICVTNGPYSVAFAAGDTGDADLDGKTFLAVDHRFVSISAVHQKEGGGDTVTAMLSHLPSIDDALATTLGNRANFQGRYARFWKQMRDPQSQAPIGGLWHHHSGVMSTPKVQGDPDNLEAGQVISIEIESYLTFFAAASNRTYLNQSWYDPGDQSAELTIATANGVGVSGSPMAGYAGSLADQSGTLNAY